MTRPTSQARAARRLRRTEAWIGENPDAMALAAQLVYLAQAMDDDAAVGATNGATAQSYLDTRSALLALRPTGA